LWLKTYPRGDSPTPQQLLGGVSTQGTGRFDRAIETAQKEVAANPENVLAYTNLASSYFFLGRLPESESNIQQALEHKLQARSLLVMQYSLAAVKGDKDQMDRIMALARSKKGAEHWVSHAESLALARSGLLQAARLSSNRAIELAVQAGQRDKAASYRA